MRTARVAAVAVFFGSLLPLGGAVPSACAAEGPHAALVVDTGASSDALRYCVALPDGSVTGIELIELASEQHGLQYRLGYGGNVVCQLAGVGYESDECLKEGPEFWGYWRGDGSGGWDWSSSGGRATTVRNGDVEGWAWGTGNDGSTHPAPPETTFEAVCGSVAAPPPERDERTDRSDGKKGDRRDGDSKVRSSTTPGVAVGDSEERAPEKKTKPRRSRERDKRKKNDSDTSRARRRPKPTSPDPSETVSATATAHPVASEPTSSGGGPPLGGLVAAGAAAACLGGGVLLQRRRMRER